MKAAAYRPPAPEAVKAARARAGLTQAQAAERVGVHVRSWQRWELGERKMPQPAWRLFLTLTQPAAAVEDQPGQGTAEPANEAASRRQRED